MNANSIALAQLAGADESSPMTGFGRFLSKEACEWVRTRRFVILALAATGLALSGVMIERVNQMTGAASKPINLDPSYNLTMVGWDSLVPLLAAFATMGLITAERERGTLAWSLSMPLSRPAVLLAKLLAAVVFLGIAGVAIPEIVSVAVIRFVYDGFPHGQQLLWEPLGGLAAGAFVVALNIAVGTFVKSQAVVVATTLCFVLSIQALVGLLSQDLSRFLPSGIYEFVTDFGKGAPVHLETLLAWLVGTVVLVIVALVRFGRSEI
jgi:ABC-type transport system involved in multi-copper enzyme maturation permease subunit